MTGRPRPIAASLAAGVALMLLTPVVTILPAQAFDSAWTIKAGSFAGQRIAIDKNAASRRSSRFWRISDIGGQKRIVGWNPSRLPARVAFRPGRGISAADSVSFWAILEQMQKDMGMRLFEPASLPIDSDPDDLIVVDTKPMTSAEGLTLVTWGHGGSLYDARVFVRAAETLRNARVVTHEMMHALGFGHTAAWTSVMNGYGGGGGGLTAEDVAYAQFALQSRVATEREDMWARLALAVEREGPEEPKPGESVCPNEAFGSFLMDVPSRRLRPVNMDSLRRGMSCASR